MRYNTLYIFCDGSYMPDRQCGGWAALLWFNKTEKLVSGGMENGISNQYMEVVAALNGLKEVNTKYKGEIVVVTDYLQLVEIMAGYVGIPRSQLLLIRELKTLCEQLCVTWEWVKSHNNHPQNEQVDQVARREARRLVARPVRP